MHARSTTTPAARSRAAGVPPTPRSLGHRSPGHRLSAFMDRHVLAVFTTPAVAFIVLTMAFPVVFTIYLSLTHWVGGLTRAPEFIGLDNFIRLLTDDPRFWGATFRTLALTAGAVAAQTVIGVAIAVLLHRRFVISGLIRSVVLLPMIATPVAVALVWRLMFHPQLGVLNDILTRMGLPPSDWLADPQLALFLVGLVDTWEWAPLIALITLAGLTALPEDPFEAAQLDGANGWQRFWHVTLPMVRPIVVVAVVFRLIEALKTFDLILVMTNGGPGFETETLNIYVYNIAFQYQQLGYASALLIIFFLLVLLISSSVLRLRRPKDS
ncbi:sugar ABC transporter permease [Microbacterium pseudoresistens]|uniref:Multiple sugar transport system permease protein n=2 Tax=Microbacterium pseudoresistens TaxID=640634 RepID=A0A7Y9JLY6_9MICO|nr:multiple sugar transport system permease protein [Microbacterium pseudoresistens]